MSNQLKVICVFLGALGLGLLQGCAVEKNTRDVSTIGGKGNPADVYCSSVGGKVQAKQNVKGAYSVCSFSDGLQVDTWELYRANHQS
ncbi:putative hemolysin [Pragia fontium]|uniref:DUF333 domain-containing protein n=2 Tax=Pragia fontium TaxID=82985 RepID=A0AAJ5BGC5_9GAMM|nr:DUF333 domain-containing protein [Pragia fontium]AKJ41837.1 hypothetical protein QQ39_06850 [Pragia fontium]SFC36665.1 hypothetical protein SAMN02745723_102189 [Pragia fontium DSM 5563 = ATCC 49100]SUB82054.1 Putative hemolysin [Pragia fontium]VEJ54678.1 Putative hemolysin [Pragia fontium]GKX62146.1 hypothetical protein SOASR032_07150 [Pragia fontium]